MGPSCKKPTSRNWEIHLCLPKKWARKSPTEDTTFLNEVYGKNFFNHQIYFLSSYNTSMVSHDEKKKKIGTGFEDECLGILRILKNNSVASTNAIIWLGDLVFTASMHVRWGHVWAETSMEKKGLKNWKAINNLPSSLSGKSSVCCAVIENHEQDFGGVSCW